MAQNKAALTGIIVIILMALLLRRPVPVPPDQVATQLSHSLHAPSSAHPLGTDNEGYDELGRLMLGGQTSLEVGIAAALVATVIGVLWGSVAGFAGGLIDGLMMRIVDALLAIPTLFLLIYLFTVYQADTVLLIFVIGLVAWLVPARLVRAETLPLRTREYVEAVRVMGGQQAADDLAACHPEHDRHDHGQRHVPDR